MSLKTYIAKMASDRSISQSKLAETCGICKWALSKTVNGDRNFTHSEIKMLTDGLGLTKMEEFQIVWSTGLQSRKFVVRTDDLTPEQSAQIFEMYYNFRKGNGVI
jgi:predicted transcriptional regulator|tara:strand:- start:338 stop:652 length:315 start_codon:yes stop_codon:yes gene_type:complete